MVIKILEQIGVTNCGPEVAIDGVHRQEIFLNQGSLDGACGPYSVFMGLITLGLVDREEARAYYHDGRTRLGKLLNLLNEYPTLFKDGTDIHQLEELLVKTYGSLLLTESRDTKGKDIISFTIEHLKNNRPTIVGVNFSGGEHWMLAVGFEEGGESGVEKLLLLDPSGGRPTVSGWNSIIDLNVTKSGRYPYAWWTDSCHVQFEHALAIWRK